MNRNKLSYLEQVWAGGGQYGLKRYFNTLALQNRREALRLLNDERLCFPVFFILIPAIEEHKMQPDLCRRNITASRLCGEKTKSFRLNDSITGTADGSMLYSTLLWMFYTGKDWSGPSERRDVYDAVMDYISALLVIAFEDRDVLKDVAALIFHRNRQGLLIHDLVWCFFQTLDRDALAFIADYLLSNDQRDVELARKLLRLDLTATDNKAEARKARGQFLRWLEENRPYLYLTGEHFQQTSKPMHMDTDSEAKYLGKEISPRHRAPIEPLTKEEAVCLYKYRAMPDEDKVLLSDYSSHLRMRDMRLWDTWMQKQTAEQVFAAKTALEAV